MTDIKELKDELEKAAYPLRVSGDSDKCRRSYFLTEISGLLDESEALRASKSTHEKLAVDQSRRIIALLDE